MSKKNIVWGVSFPDPALLEYAKEQANLDDRSLSKWVCRLIEAHRTEQQQMRDAPAIPAMRREVKVSCRKSSLKAGANR